MGPFYQTFFVTMNAGNFPKIQRWKSLHGNHKKPYQAFKSPIVSRKQEPVVDVAHADPYKQVEVAHAARDVYGVAPRSVPAPPAPSSNVAHMSEGSGLILGGARLEQRIKAAQEVVRAQGGADDNAPLKDGSLRLAPSADQYSLGTDFTANF
jgi:hypothetical protein